MLERPDEIRFNNRWAAGHGIAFILPTHNGFVYARRAALSFFKHTPQELGPLCILVDDGSDTYDQQNWDHWYDGLHRGDFVHARYKTANGLTRSWNYGLKMARFMECKYAFPGNNDILFSEGWYEGLLHHLDREASLVGPVTNAPGLPAKSQVHQDVETYLHDYVLSDDAGMIQRTARELRQKFPITDIRYAHVNGFFFGAKVETFWQHAFDEHHVFDPQPKYRIAGNEDELERRWQAAGLRLGIVPSSFMFHYRSVTRGDKFRCKGAVRLDDMHKPV